MFNDDFPMTGKMIQFKEEIKEVLCLIDQQKTRKCKLISFVRNVKDVSLQGTELNANYYDIGQPIGPIKRQILETIDEMAKRIKLIQIELYYFVTIHILRSWNVDKKNLISI